MFSSFLLFSKHKLYNVLERLGIEMNYINYIYYFIKLFRIDRFPCSISIKTNKPNNNYKNQIKHHMQDMVLGRLNIDTYQLRSLNEFQNKDLDFGTLNILKMKIERLRRRTGIFSFEILVFERNILQLVVWVVVLAIT